MKCPRCAAKTAVTVQPPEAERPPEAPQPSDQPVGQLLIAENAITPQQLAEALERQRQEGGRLFENLIALKYLDTKTLHQFLSKRSGVPSIDLTHYEIPPELLSLIPREFARRNVVLPIDKMGKLLTVGMACPLDTAAIAETEQITGLKVKAMLCAFDDINAMIKRCYPGDPQTFVAKRAPTPPRSTQTPKSAASERQATLAKLAELDLLPPLPATLDQVRNAGRTPHIRDVAGIVCADPSVTAALLSLANCSPYGLSGQVINVNLAVALLGVQGTLAATAHFERAPALDARAQFSFRPFWLRSMFCATASMALARASGRGDVGGAYTAGLLHDIGRLALAVSRPELYQHAAAETPDAERLKQEEDLFGLDHLEAARIMTAKWRLPEAVAEPIHLHHASYSSANGQDLVVIVALAAAMADAFVREAPLSNALDRCKDAMRTLVLHDSAVARISETTAVTVSAIEQQEM